MARQIIVLESRKSGDGTTSVSGVNWFPIAAADARVPKPGMQSAAKELSGAAVITAGEQTALETGAVREEGFGVLYAASTPLTQIKTDLVRRWTDRAAAIAAEPATRAFFGISYDGTAWSA